jgi:hypothetical protein
VTRPFDQLFPLNGDLGYNLCAGHLPDGTPALAAGSFGQWLLITFTDDGHIGDVEVRESSVRVKEGPGGADSFALGTAFREWVDEKARLESGLIWVREFAVENLSIELWDSTHAERVSSPFVIPLGAWNAQDWRDQCAKARSWLERRNFVINWFNDYWADWRGKIHSS